MKKVMVERVLFITIISIFLCSGIFAVTSGTCAIISRGGCGNNATTGYIVMGLSSATNAHGENYTTTGIYPYVLCCDFGNGVQPNECIDNPNPIIKLSSSTNAHAEIPSGTTYSTKVCYEDLQCIGTTSDCGSGNAINYPLGIVSLSSVTNAHIGGINDYPTKICCRSSLFTGCNMVSATWNQDSVEDGTKVYLEITGSSSADCSGKSVAFNVEGEGGSDIVECNASTFAEEGSEYCDLKVSFAGATARGSWYAEHQRCGIWPFEHDCKYSFTATLAKNPDVNILSGAPIPLLTVEEREGGIDNFCAVNNIQSCEDYKNEPDCSSDAGLCNVAKDSGGGIVDCNSESIVCACAWDSIESKCRFGYTEIGGGNNCDPATDEACCEPGETLCADNICKDDCGAIGDNCNEDEICDANEGCTCRDCDGKQDSCDYGSICSEFFGACACDYGFTLCRDGEISYCNLGNTCPSGQIPGNNNGTCDFGIDGCLSPDCPDGSQDTCVLGTYCMNGKCSSVEAPPITLGNCKITQEVITDCEEGGGIKTIRITGTWTGEGECGQACQKCNAMDDTPITVPCPAQVQLPFFDYIGIIATITAIVIIYVLLVLKKKVKRKKIGKKKK